MAGQRQRARTLALQALYEADLSGHSATESLERLLEEYPLPLQAHDYTRNLVAAVDAHRQEIDGLISEIAPQWPVDQIAIVDRTVLRIAIVELRGLVPTHAKLTAPPKAIINESVDLAKRFGSDGSPGFVNGVLGSVAAKVLGLTSSKAPS